MTKKKTLVNESVVRRWGKLANMQPLTENWLETLSEEDEGEEEMEAARDEEKAEDEMDYAEGDLERAGDSGEAMLEPDVAEEIAAELVQTLQSKLSDLAGGADVIDIVDDEDDMMDLGDDEVEMDMEVEMDDEVAMGDVAYNRTDEIEERKKYSWKKGGKNNPSGKKDDGESKGDLKKDPRDYQGNRQDEELDVEMIDDEALTEAVLARVVERLLSKN